MNSYRQHLFQIVFSTKHREKTVTESRCHLLYRYIWGIVKNHKCRLYRINGVEDHIHIVCDLHPDTSLSHMIKDIKVSSSIWMKANGFEHFKGWNKGYASFTYSPEHKDRVIEYVKRQKEHHKKVSYPDEMKSFCLEQEIEFNEKYLP